MLKKLPKSNRIAQIQELVKHELGQILLREVEMPEQAVVTLTRVVASGNLQIAKVYISVVPDQKAPEVLKILEQNVFEIQQILNERLKMRPVPKIEWVVDSTGTEAQKIEELLEQIKKEVQ